MSAVLWAYLIVAGRAPTKPAFSFARKYLRPSLPIGRSLPASCIRTQLAGTTTARFGVS